MGACTWSTTDVATSNHSVPGTAEDNIVAVYDTVRCAFVEEIVHACLRLADRTVSASIVLAGEVESLL
jgi:hypothetical protein